ncbi:MAG: GLPGLI family protein [Flavobacteriaceae bacterium]
MRSVILLVLIFFFMNSYAQNYELKFRSTSHLTVDLHTQTNMSDKQINIIEKEFRRKVNHTYVLRMNSEESYYKAQKDGNGLSIVDMGVNLIIGKNNGGDIYKNLPDSTFVQQPTLSGDVYTIKDKFQPYAWELVDSTKTIKGYTCKLAKFPTNSDNNSIANFRHGLDKKNGPHQGEVNVWYTEEIPISNGPDLYWGLPGLILEADAGNTFYELIEITENPKDFKISHLEDDGQVINHDDFQVVLKKWHDDLGEKFSKKKD